jgi:hypothetical protein
MKFRDRIGAAIVVLGAALSAAASSTLSAQTLGCGPGLSSVQYQHCVRQRQMRGARPIREPAAREYEKWDDGTPTRGAGTAAVRQEKPGYFLGGLGTSYGYGR